MPKILDVKISIESALEEIAAKQIKQWEQLNDVGFVETLESEDRLSLLEML